MYILVSKTNVGLIPSSYVPSDAAFRSFFAPTKFNYYADNYAPITVMPHLPPTGHRRGLVHFYVLIPCPLGVFGGLIPGVILDLVKLS